MGVRTYIGLDEINDLIQDINISFKSIEKTSDGISDSTYIGITNENQKYIFKIYEFATKDEVSNEIRILNTLKKLPTPKPLTNENEIKEYQDKPIAIFSYLKGQSFDEPTLEQCAEIGTFLGKFHFFSKNIKSVNKNIYSQKEMKTFIDNIMKHNEVDGEVKQSFFDKYELIKNISLEENCVIHGDLFPDNAKFIGDKLTAVFDFVEACNGNFFFDLAVVINSWCFDKKYNLVIERFNAILDKYNEFAPIKVNQDTIKEYMMYAALFYACQRFNTKYIEKRDANVKDYNEYLIKFTSISQV